jgi:hypothetical protein
MQMEIQLASAPREQPSTRPDWPVIRLDGFMHQPGSTELAQPVALIQLIGNGRIRCPLPEWCEGDTVTLTPLASCAWGDETGRCYLDLYLQANCAGREGWIDGLIPYNPDLYDFTQDAKK